MKITLEIEYGKDFDHIPDEFVLDALTGIKTLIRDDMINKWRNHLKYDAAPITVDLEISREIDT